jgi:diguanylate cyclase (GGDEF)-like protein/PAS domain S-box-containing protein
VATKLLRDFRRRFSRLPDLSVSDDVHPHPWRSRTRSWESTWFRYLLAVLAPLALIELELVLGLFWVGATPALTVLLIPTVFSAALGGLGPGLAATAAAALGADFFLIPPVHSFKIAGSPNTLAWLGLIVVGMLVSLLSEMLHRARFRAEANAQRFRFLARAGAVLASSLDYKATLQNIAKLAIEGPASLCGFYLLAEDGSPYLVTRALAQPSVASAAAQLLADSGNFLTSKRAGLTHPVLRTLQSGRSLLVPVVDDEWIAANAVSDEHERFLRELGIHSMLVVPVADSSGCILGTLTLVLTANDKRSYDESDLAFAEELGRRAGTAIQNARNYAHEVAYRRIVDTTHDGVLMLDDNQCITFVNSRMVELLGYADASEIAGHPLVDFLCTAEATAPKRLARRQQGGIDEDNELCFRRRDGSHIWTLAAAMPLIGADGAVAGSQSLMITDITERKRAEAELAENAQRFRVLAEERHHAAYHDALTGLPNRALFLDRLGQALVRMRRHPTLMAAVLFVDLDRFKVINDSLGHGAGDQLLAAFGERLTRYRRPYDMVARLGGDEFTILLDDVATTRDATLAAERILRAIEQPFNIAGREVSITASIGIALGQAGFEDAETMLRDADIAMYRAKELGRARYELFAPELHARTMARLELEIELRGALERGGLRLAYQPIVALETGRIAGFEALARWQRAGEMIPPDVFIPLAEETGLIHALGEWALGEACRQAHSWEGLRPEGPPLTVSVNISGKQLAAHVLGGQVKRVLAESGLRPEHLQLEITESVLMDRINVAETVLDRVRSLGVKIDLDDFGTGYSSLSYLQRLPIDTLKIDRSFISGAPGTGISNPEIVEAIVSMAHSLGLGVTAEGVETAEQLSQLQALRCTNAQGYYLSRPVDEAGARALVAA